LENSETVSKVRNFTTEGVFFPHFWQYYRSRKNKHFGCCGKTRRLEM